MSSPKGEDDEVPLENVLQREDPDAGGSDLDVVRGFNTLSALTAESSEEKELQPDSTEQAKKSDENDGLAIPAAEEVSTDTGQVNPTPTSGGHSSTSDHHKGPLSLNDEKRSSNPITSIHATGHDPKVDPSAKEVEENYDGSEQRLNHGDKILTSESHEGGGIAEMKPESGSDTLPQIQTPNNMTVKVDVGSESFSRIQTLNAIVPSSQSNQEKFDFSGRSEKCLDKLQPRRNPETSIHSPHSPSVTPEKPSEDGFNWRKYGQKLVKGNEFVRSYYRCTYFNCLAKKQVERSNAGQITDINYIGEHEHPKLQHMPQVGIAVIQSPPMREPEVSVMSSPEGITNAQPLTLRKPEELPIVSSPKAETFSTSHSIVSQSVESRKVAFPSTLAKVSPLDGSTRDKVDNTSGPDVKRQKTDNSSWNEPVLNKHSSDAKQVVQTMSEVDLVNDGYRWRKYGQKLVKGSPNPRSYYRCSNSGCPVKKHVERASHDPKLVITTYEGHHDHDMPFTRTVTQNTSGEGGAAAVFGESRSSETGENKTNGLEMVFHISAN